MIRVRVRVALVAAVLAASLAPAASAADPVKKAAKQGGTMIGHMVYFQLKDNSPAAREKLVAACKKYLADHDGVVYFAAGVIGDSFARDVNDREWEVALHVVFADKAAHDKYQTAETHLKFIEENKENWKKVRVFDSYITGAVAGKATKKAAA